MQSLSADAAQLAVTVDADGQTVLRPDDPPRETAPQSHEALHLFNAPRTMRGQTTMEGIE